MKPKAPYIAVSPETASSFLNEYSEDVKADIQSAVRLLLDNVRLVVQGDLHLWPGTDLIMPSYLGVAGNFTTDPSPGACHWLRPPKLLEAMEVSLCVEQDDSGSILPHTIRTPALDQSNRYGKNLFGELQKPAGRAKSRASYIRVPWTGSVIVGVGSSPFLKNERLLFGKRLKLTKNIAPAFLAYPELFHAAVMSAETNFIEELYEYGDEHYPGYDYLPKFLADGVNSKGDLADMAITPEYVSRLGASLLDPAKNPHIKRIEKFLNAHPDHDFSMPWQECKKRYHGSKILAEAAKTSQPLTTTLDLV